MYDLHSLGGVAILDASGAEIRLRSRKHLALLVFLVASGRRVYTRRELASLFWVSAEPRARHSLSQAIYDLRRNLQGLVVGSPAEEFRIDPTKVRFDVHEMELAVREGRLCQAIELYRGPFAPNLEGIATSDFDRWLESERHRLKCLIELSLRRYVQESEGAARWGDMTVAALRLLEMNPLDEESHRSLMRGLWLHGDRTSALRHYEQLESFFRREVPNGVSSQTRELAARIRSAQLEETSIELANPLTPLVGRRHEFEHLKTAVQRLLRHQGGVVVTEGESGIGKTRLVREFAHWLSLEPVTLLGSRCYAAECDIAYAPVVDALRPIVTAFVKSSPNACRRYVRLGYLFLEMAPFLQDHPEPIDPGAWRRLLYEEVAELLAEVARAKPIVWIVEDVHWIDSTSRSLLHYVSRRLSQEKLLFVLTRRVDRGTVAHSSFRAGDTPGQIARLRLGPLSHSDVKHIVGLTYPRATDHPALEIVCRLAAGNPFYALELFQASLVSGDWLAEAEQWDPLTDARLADVFAIRFQDLGRIALQILMAVAVLDRHASPRAVAKVAGLSMRETARGANKLYELGLLEDGEPCICFNSELVRNYVYGNMTLVQRTACHLTAGELLEGEPDVGVAILARHYYFGDHKFKAFRYGIAAAQEASEAGAHEEASALATMALSSARHRTQKLEALRLVAHSELLAAQVKAAQQHFTRLLELDDSLAISERIETKLHIIEALGGEAAWEKVESEITRLYKEVRVIDDRSLRLDFQLELLTWQIRAATRTNACDHAARLSSRVRSLWQAASRSGCLSQSAHVRACCAMAAYALFYQSAESALCLLRTCDRHLQHVPVEFAYRVSVLKGLASLRVCDWDAAEHESKKALQLLRAENDTLLMSAALTNLACCAIERGDWGQGSTILSQLHELYEPISGAPDVTLPILINTGNLAFYQGEAARAYQLYDQALQLASEHEVPEVSAELVACVGLTALATGRLDRAHDSWGHIQNLNPDSLKGIQERFKVEWFRAFMLRSEDPQKLRKRLLDLGQHVLSFDRPTGLKLQWLAELLCDRKVGGPGREARARLKAVSMGWFAHFSERWLRTVLSRRAAGP